MNRLDLDRYQPTFSKQHESKLQHLRHERSVELVHLIGLKKALETKLQAQPSGERPVRVA